MIAKIIHLCWLSGDPFPTEIQKCLYSWKLFLPDYEVWLWGKIPDGACENEFKNMSVKQMSFDLDSTIWTKQAYQNKKFAFAADYIRLYALYNFGGIYLDSDILIYKSFDELLRLPYFIGQDYEHSLEAAVIGCEKRTKWIYDILKYYENRSFVKKDGSLDIDPLPHIFYYQLYNKYSIIRLHRYYVYENNENSIFVFDKDFFNSRTCLHSRKTRKSYCTHNYAGTWKVRSNGIKSKIKKMIPMFVLDCYFSFAHHTFSKNQIGQFEMKIIEEIW